MGRIASSSKKKASKRKSSKLSSEDRKRKKSRKIKSKKLRHHDDSSYSDDDSMSSVSVSSTSSEGDYRSRKVQSRSRSDARSGKKKSRKRSPSPTRSKDPSRTKKRKRLDKDVDSKSKKKSRKIKRKRKISISSTSSDSSSSEESESERRRGRSRERRISKRDPLKTKAGNRKSRSPSYSSSSRYSHPSRSVSPFVEQIVPHNGSRRLKSVISVVEHRDEIDDNKSEKDPYEEEIVYDRNEYPSSRSNDSIDGVSRRKSTYLSRVASEEEITLSNLREKDPIDDEVDCSGQHEGADSYRVKTTILDKENEAEIPITTAGSGNDDLELILRQKALENLRRFRGERQMKSKTTTINSPNNDPLSAAMAEDVHKNSLKFDASNEQCAATDIEMSDNPILERNLTTQAEIGTNNSGGGKTENDPGFSKQIRKPLSGISKNEENSTAYAVNEKYESGISAPGQEDLSSCSEVKQATTSSVPFDSNLMASKSIAIEKEPSISPGVQVDNICNSTSKEPKNLCDESTSAEQSSKEHQDESKDASQFEKKTMTVMRGGEMVQVNYKVYIPKKVPALARRQLKR